MIPWRYRNAINPRQTASEQRAQTKTLDRVVKSMRDDGMTEDEIDRVLMADDPSSRFTSESPACETSKP